MGGIEVDTILGIGMILALGAGALSFLSPCVLPIFPAYLSYITGISVGYMVRKIRIKGTMKNEKDDFCGTYNGGAWLDGL